MSLFRFVKTLRAKPSSSMDMGLLCDVMRWPGPEPAGNRGTLVLINDWEKTVSKSPTHELERCAHFLKPERPVCRYCLVKAPEQSCSSPALSTFQMLMVVQKLRFCNFVFF